MADNPTPKPKKRIDWDAVALFVIIVCILLIGLLSPSTVRLWTWLGILVLLAVFSIIAGHSVIGMWRGLLIDERNKISLSRLQMVLWTIVVLSGFFAAALSNISSRQTDPLLIALPAQLWLLMGISTTSLVASPLILSTKKTQPPKAEEVARTAALMEKQAINTGAVSSEGQVVINTSPEYARWADLFKGEETGNAAHLDLGKIQMFYFTLIVVFAYAVALGAEFVGNAGKLSAFPDLDSGLVALLGISHAGYLTNKAIPHSQS